MIERYYCDNKCNPKAIMSQNTAKEVQTAIKAFLTACAVMTPYSVDNTIIRYRVGEYVAKQVMMLSLLTQCSWMLLKKGLKNCLDNQ